MWRPEGWNNPYLKSNVPEWEEIRKVYEAGADAMAEAVVELAKALLDGKSEEIFAYGGPTYCEYGCLEGLIKILQDKDDEAINSGVSK